MLITLKLLQELDACNPAIRLFVRYAGERAETGVPLEEVLAHPEMTEEYKVWLCGELDKSFIYYIRGIAFREAAKVCPELAPFAMNVTPDNTEAAWAEAAEAAARAAEAAVRREIVAEAERRLLDSGKPEEVQHATP